MLYERSLQKAHGVLWTRRAQHGTTLCGNELLEIWTPKPAVDRRLEIDAVHEQAYQSFLLLPQLSQAIH